MQRRHRYASYFCEIFLKIFAKKIISLSLIKKIKIIGDI